jgi:hypothetical protein
MVLFFFENSARESLSKFIREQIKNTKKKTGKENHGYGSRDSGL